MILMSDYGSMCSEHTYILEKKKMKYMYYHDLLQNTIVELGRKDSSRIFSSYINFNGEESKSEILFGNSPLVSFKKKLSSPEFHAYENSENHGNLFDVKFSSNGHDFCLSFPKERVVIAYPEDNSCTVFGRNKKLETDFKNPYEYYQFTEKGFFCRNKDEKMLTCCYDGKIVDYKFLFKKEKFDCIPLDECPTVIDYIENETKKKSFRLRYDAYGLIDKCSDENHDNLSRYEFTYDESVCYAEAIVIHPHLFDGFNYDYIDDPLNYWVADHLTVSHDVVTFERRIYKIDMADKLIQDLSKNQDIPIISEFR